MVRITVTAVDRGGPGPASGIEQVQAATGLDRGNFVESFLRRVGPNTFRGVFRFPPGVGSARQTIDLLSLSDRAGNSADYGLADLRELGLPSIFTVTSRRNDSKAPQLTDLRLSTTLLDTRRGSRSLRVRLRARDDYAGVEDVAVELLTGDIFTEDRTSLHRDQSHPGWWIGRLRVSAWGQNRTPHLTIEVSDRVGNRRTYGPRALQRAGFPSRITVLAIPDTTRPVIRLLSFTPRVFDARTAPVTARIVVRAKDADSGIRRVEVFAGGVGLAGPF